MVHPLALPRRLSNSVRALQQLILPFERPWFALLFSLVFFFLLTSLAGAPWRVTDRAYYNYQADAWLHGQFYLRVLPQNTLDLSLYQGRYYLYWGPVPSLIAVPAVAIFGVSASDVLQSIAFGSLNAALFALLLRRTNQRGITALEPWQRAVMVVLFALGTSHTPLTGLGQVWFMGELIALNWMLLAYLAAFSLKNWSAFFWTGCAVAAVFLTRMSAIVIALFLVWYLLRQHWSCGWKRLLSYCLLGLLPVVAALALQGWYDLVRFGSPLETGVSYHLMHKTFVANYQKYGLFSLHYFPANFFYTYIFHPFISWMATGELKLVGGSIFFLSPLLFAAFYALWQDRRSPLTWMLAVTFLLGNIPILLLMEPTLQFGSRYALDFFLPLLLLTAMGMRRWPAWLVFLLTFISAFDYIAGALMFLFVPV